VLGGDPTLVLWHRDPERQARDQAEVAEGTKARPAGRDAVDAMYGMPHSATAVFQFDRATSAKRPRFRRQVMGPTGIIEITTGYLPSVNTCPIQLVAGQSGANGKASLDFFCRHQQARADD